MKASLIPAAARPYAAALAAVLLWATQASLAASLSHVPPFLLTGLALVCGGLPALPRWRRWSSVPMVYGVGIYGLFVYHLLYFIALRTAPAVEANLVQYLWPSLIVLLTPLFLKNVPLRRGHVAGVLLGFCGSALVILAGGSTADTGFHAGYLYACGAAVVWATFSLMLKRMPPHSTWTVGAICLASGLLSLALHALFEPAVALSTADLGLIAVTGLGPLGLAFYLWSYAVRHGDSRIVGVLAYAIPVLSTVLLIIVTGRGGSTAVLGSAVLVVAGGVVATRAGRKQAAET